jgi:hypothetical protein
MSSDLLAVDVVVLFPAQDGGYSVAVRRALAAAWDRLQEHGITKWGNGVRGAKVSWA